MKSSLECYKIIYFGWHNFGAAGTTTLVAKISPVHLAPDSPGATIYNVYIEQYNSINNLTAIHLNQAF
jgi:hypothetical protein